MERATQAEVGGIVDAKDDHAAREVVAVWQRTRSLLQARIRVAALVYLRRHTNDEMMTTTKQIQAAVALLPSSVLSSCCTLIPIARVLYMMGRWTETTRHCGSPSMTTENDEAKCTKVLGWCLHGRFPKGVTF